MRVLIYALQRSTAPTGLCRYTANLVTALRYHASDIDVDLVIGAWQKEYYNRIFGISAPDVSVLIPTANNTLYGRYCWPMINIGQLSARLGSDIVHFASPSAFCRSLIDVPVVTTVHDLYAYSHPNAFRIPNRLLNRSILSNAVSNSDATQIISRCTKAEMDRFFPRQMAHGDHRVIYQPVAVTAPTPAPLAASPYILCVAGHRKHKNLPLVIDAMRMLMDRRVIGKDTTLTIVGEHSTETRLIQELAARQSVALQLLSSLSDQHLANLYGNCLAFVAPSEVEGFCLPLVEALMHGKRVVCSDIPIFHEVGRDSCSFFGLGSDRTKNLADALANALNQPEPQSQANRFGFSRFASECTASYANALRSQNCGR